MTVDSSVSDNILTRHDDWLGMAVCAPALSQASVSFEFFRQPARKLPASYGAR